MHFTGWNDKYLTWQDMIGLTGRLYIIVVFYGQDNLNSVMPMGIIVLVLLIIPDADCRILLERDRFKGIYNGASLPVAVLKVKIQIVFFYLFISHGNPLYSKVKILTAHLLPSF